MIEIRQLSKPAFGSNYGPDREVRIGRASIKLLGMSPKIKPGQGFDFMVVRDESGLASALRVVNISGLYFLRSPTVKVEDWPKFFGVKIY